MSLAFAWPWASVFEGTDLLTGMFDDHHNHPLEEANKTQQLDNLDSKIQYQYTNITNITRITTIASTEASHIESCMGISSPACC
jgi:hypothetical protein